MVRKITIGGDVRDGGIKEMVGALPHLSFKVFNHESTIDKKGYWL